MDAYSGADIVGDFGAAGLWLKSGASAWTCLTGDNPQYLGFANPGGDGNQELLVDFGPLGLFLWDSGAWTCLTTDNPD